MGGLWWEVGPHGDVVTAASGYIRDGELRQQTVYVVSRSSADMSPGWIAWRYRVGAVRQARTWYTRRAHGPDIVMVPYDGIPWEIHGIEDDELYLIALDAWYKPR